MVKHAKVDIELMKLLWHHFSSSYCCFRKELSLISSLASLEAPKSAVFELLREGICKPDVSMLRSRSL